LSGVSLLEYTRTTHSRQCCDLYVITRSENCQKSGEGHQLNWLDTITRRQVWSTFIARASRRRQDWDRWRT